MSIALVTSLTFLNLGSSTQDLQYRVFAIFIVTVLPAIIISQTEPFFIMSRETFNREASSKVRRPSFALWCTRRTDDCHFFSQMYSSVVFSIAQLTAEMPYSVLCAVVFFLLFYFPCVPFFRSDSPSSSSTDALLAPFSTAWASTSALREQDTSS